MCKEGRFLRLCRGNTLLAYNTKDMRCAFVSNIFGIESKIVIYFSVRLSCLFVFYLVNYSSWHMRKTSTLTRKQLCLDLRKRNWFSPHRTRANKGIMMFPSVNRVRVWRTKPAEIGNKGFEILTCL